MRYVVLSLTFGLLVLAGVLAACGDEERTPTDRDAKQRYDRNGSSFDGKPAPSTQKNLVVIVIDTLRADCVVKPDGSPGVMPNLAALREKAVAFDRAFAPAAWTEPSMTSLLTGMLPREHGCVVPGSMPRIPEACVTYAEVLRSTYGYETAAFTDMRSFRQQPWSILQGFKRGSRARGLSALANRPMERGFGFEVSADVLDDWMSARDPERPFCLLLHTFDAHDPYGKHNRPIRTGDPEVARRAQEAAANAFDTTSVAGAREYTRQFLTSRAGRDKLFREKGRAFSQAVASYMGSEVADAGDEPFVRKMHDAYESGARWVDQGLQTTMEALRSRGLLENTLLVVTSDHGEAFGEHGTMSHGHHLHAELTHVPLVMVGPGPFAEPKKIDSTVALMDVFPTFFDWAGIDLPVGVHGRSLLPALRGEQEPRVIVSETTVTDHMAGPGTYQLWMSRRADDWSFLICYDRDEGTVFERAYRGEDGEELHDLAVDGTLLNVDFAGRFCESVEEARELIWTEVESAQQRAGTVYGAGIEQLRTTRPAPCDPPR